MNSQTPRNALLATAIAATFALTACGEARNDTAPRTSRSDTPTTMAPTTTDRMTADASAAANRAGTSAQNAGEKIAGAAGDAATTAKVKARLMAEPGIDSLQIDVDTNNGNVTLTGQVDTPQNKARAKELASSIEGVTGVVDRLSMKSS